MDGLFGGARACLMASAAIVCVAAATPAYAQTRNFNVPEQDAATGVAQFARQADLQLLISARDARGHRTNTVRGAMSVQDGLRQLLDGTGLRAEPTGTSTYSVVPVAGEDQAGGAAADSESASAEIVVTGTLIRGNERPASPLIVIDRDAIERSGQPTFSRLMRNVPQNFGGSSEQVDADTQGSNLGGGTSVNLRGLGLDTTLVLINGHRLAKSGSGGTFFDLDSIPTNAIDRVEILTDGASATYGADAIGGVVNVLMRRNYQGASFRLRQGIATQGGYDETDLGVSGGTHWNGGSAFFAVNWSHQSRLTQDERDFTRGNDFTDIGGSNFQLTYATPGNVRAVDGFLNASNLSTPAGVFVPLPNLTAGQPLNPTQVRAGPLRATNIAEGAALVPRQNRFGAYLSVEQAVSDRLVLYGDFLGSVRDFQSSFNYPITQATVPANNPFNPFGEAVQVRYAFTQFVPISITHTTSYGGTVGARLDLGRWQADLGVTAGWESIDQRLIGGTIDSGRISALVSLSDPSQSINLLGAPGDLSRAQLAAIQNRNFSTSDSNEQSVRLVADGPLSLGLAEPVHFAVGAEYRRSAIETHQRTLNALDIVTFQRDRVGSEDNVALFGEALIPLLVQQPFAERLELTLAGRMERTRVETVFVPKASLLWSPLRGLSFRGTWGESYKAPLLRDLNEAEQQTTTVISLLDPRTGATSTPNVTLLNGGNPDLKPETAETWAMNVEFRPPSIRNLILRAGYFNVRFKNRVVRPLTDFLINNELSIPGAIERGPGVNGGVGPIIFIDQRARNLAVVETSGFDVSAQYAFGFLGGQMDVSLAGTYIDHYVTRVYDGAPTLNVLDTLGFPPRLRAQGSVGWQSGNWRVGITGNYNDDYRDSTLPTALRIGRFTPVDARISYRLDGRIFGPVLSGMTISVGANNLFDEDPPFRNARSGYDPTAADPRGRVVYLEIRGEW
jgi:outer membrane receptor protein involved in Fe transport